MSDNVVTIRDMCESDLVSGLHECLAELSPVVQPPSLSHLRAVADYRFSHRFVTLVGTFRDTVIGTISYFVEPRIARGGSFVGHIEDVVVLPGWRGTGLGSELVNEALRRLREDGCYKVILSCSQANVPFYSKFGFLPNEVSMRLDLAARPDSP